MKEYVRMYLLDTPEPGLLNLVSEVFEDLQEAEQFCDCFQNNYASNADVRHTLSEKDEYIVFAYEVPEFYIKSNYIEKYNHYIFATFKAIRKDNFANLIESEREKIKYKNSIKSIRFEP